MSKSLFSPWLLPLYATLAFGGGAIAMTAETGTNIKLPEAAAEAAARGTNLPGTDIAEQGAVVAGQTVLPLSDFLAISFGQLAIAVALFGAVITIIVIFFALRTKDAAVAEARNELTALRKEMQDLATSLTEKVNDTVRKQETSVMQASIDVLAMRRDVLELRESLKAQVDDAVGKAMSALSDLEALKNEIGITDWIYDITDLVGARQKLSPEDQAKLASRSSIVSKKNASDYTLEDFLTLFAHHTSQKEWSLLEELARIAKVNVKDRVISCTGYFQLGNSFRSRADNQKAEAEYRAAIEKFGSVAAPEVRTTVAKCRNNLITVLIDKEGWEQGLKLADEALQHLEGLKPDDRYRLRAKILINKGNCFSHLDRNDEAIEIYREVIETLQNGPPFPDKIQRIGNAYLNMACAYALKGQAESAIENLIIAGSYSEDIIPNVQKDPDFKLIADNEKFRSYLEDNGLTYNPA